MLLEPGERLISVEEQRERIKGILTSDNQSSFVWIYRRNRRPRKNGTQMQ